ncbi:MAG TPA: glucose-1-phosphate thymidylyltransferase [Aggregatilineaceae bacterium]|nr:glucose-1-phosphate thymidylyltransferase [Aggregatilineaceae bacterium]
MKAIILCAGKGTRLYPVTLTMPKPLVPVANKALVKYAIETLTNMGATEIGLVVHSLDSPIRTELGDGIDTVGVPLSYIAQEDPRGLAHAVKLSQPFIGDEPFIVYLGDNIFQDRMRALYTQFQHRNAGAAIALTEVANPSAFGIAELDGNTITRLIEKPKDPPTNLAIAGVYVFQPAVFDAIDHIKPSWRDELEITDAIQYLLEHGHTVIPYIVDGWWIDAGNADSIVLANQLVLEGLPFTPAIRDDPRIQGKSDVSHRVILGKESRIIDSVIRGPATIGENVIIRGSYIGPYTSIGNNTVIEGSEIEHSIVMCGCTIKYIKGRIDASLIADNVSVMRATSRPATHRLVLAEDSLVQL